MDRGRQSLRVPVLSMPGEGLEQVMEGLFETRIERANLEVQFRQAGYHHLFFQKTFFDMSTNDMGEPTLVSLNAVKKGEENADVACDQVAQWLADHYSGECVFNYLGARSRQISWTTEGDTQINSDSGKVYPFIGAVREFGLKIKYGKLVFEQDPISPTADTFRSVLEWAQRAEANIEIRLTSGDTSFSSSMYHYDAEPGFDLDIEVTHTDNEGSGYRVNPEGIRRLQQFYVNEMNGSFDLTHWQHRSRG